MAIEEIWSGRWESNPRSRGAEGYVGANTPLKMNGTRPVVPLDGPKIGPKTTGWPAPALCQDECRPLFRWFAERLGSRRLVREAGERIRNEKEHP